MSSLCPERGNPAERTTCRTVSPHGHVEWHTILRCHGPTSKNNRRSSQSLPSRQDCQSQACLQETQRKSKGMLFLRYVLNIVGTNYVVFFVSLSTPATWSYPASYLDIFLLIADFARWNHKNPGLPELRLSSQP